MSTTLTPYLSFDGRTREAFTFYAQALGATVEAMLRYDDMPAPPDGDGSGAGSADSSADSSGCAGGPPPTGDGIMHACLVLPGGAMLMAGDVPPGMPFNGVHGVMLALQFDTVAQAEAAFAALLPGGQTTMPMAPSFWAKTFGMLTDRFGVSWAVNGESIAMA